MAQREALAEGMRSPAVLPNPNDSEDSDGYYFSDSDEYVVGEAGGETGEVPEWSELETAVQALMGMEGVDMAEDGWDASEPAR